MELFKQVGSVVVGRRAAWVVLLVALLVSVGVLTSAGESLDSDEATAILPATAEATEAAELLRALPGGDARSAVVVYSRDGERLRRVDVEAIESDAAAFADLDGVTIQGEPRFAEGRRAAVFVAVLPETDEVGSTVGLVDDMRAITADGLPEGTSAELTGSAGFRADIGKSFSGANTRLVIVTISVVTFLLLLTYRSPILWIVPLSVVALADRVANGVVSFASRQVDVVMDGSTNGIIDILVFGAGTNYALLLIARYREELRRVESPHDAMRRALRGAGPAIFASAATVALSLLVLTAAMLPNDKATGTFGSLAIAVACAFALLVLPAALVVCGRRLFWPFIPHFGDEDRSERGGWYRIASFVSRNPLPVIAASLVFLLALASGLFSMNLGISQTDRFRIQAESVDGQRSIEQYFGAGAGDPVVVVGAADRVDDLVAAAEATDGVVSARPGVSADGITRIDVVVEDAPSSPGAQTTVRELRDAVHAVEGADAKVGGSTAVDVDWHDYAVRDFKVVAPLVLLVVLLVLVVLLRSLVAPFLLVATVVITYFAAMGAGIYAFEHIFNFAGLAVNVPVLAFIFLVALGVDYNIFLITRAREEAVHRGTRPGVVTAVAVTGGVITSAGTLLAAVFVGLGVLPIIMLTEIGFVVGVGVLLDTLLVRTVVVPALVVLVGDRFWWPRNPVPPELHDEPLKPRGDGGPGRAGTPRDPEPEPALR